MCPEDASAGWIGSRARPDPLWLLYECAGQWLCILSPRDTRNLNLLNIKLLYF